jgi:predicted AlkP superfamily pyrophosphatase or phosphodiesterase
VVKRLLVLDVVGLTPALLRHSPRLAAVAKDGFAAPMTPVLPAVTCPAQASMLTGLAPSQHGIVANGWYDRERAEVAFWKQSAHVVQGERVWDAAKKRDAKFTSANVCWWFAMYGSSDFTVTPRPAYPADGRKIPDCWTHPEDLRDRLQAELGPFPLFSFWGPKADITSTKWIAEAAKRVIAWHAPTAVFVYLPHLDYPLQKVGPSHPSIPAEVGAVDAIAGDLIDAARAKGYGVVALSEYGITAVSGAAFPNRVLREAGLVALRRDATGETLDHGASRAFAVPDHQVAHVYCRAAADVAAASTALAKAPGVEAVLEGPSRAAAGLDHPRAGDLVLLAEPDRWFAHDWWTKDEDAPDYQRTVDIHRKPGYDPRELFMTSPWRAASKLAAKKAGFRTLMDVIPLDTSLVRGSHGLPPASRDAGPVLISEAKDFAVESIPQTGVRDFLLRRLFEG